MIEKYLVLNFFGAMALAGMAPAAGDSSAYAQCKRYADATNEKLNECGRRLRTYEKHCVLLRHERDGQPELPGHEEIDPELRGEWKDASRKLKAAERAQAKLENKSAQLKKLASEVVRLEREAMDATETLERRRGEIEADNPASKQREE